MWEWVLVPSAEESDCDTRGEPAGPCALSFVYPAEQSQPSLVLHGTPWNWDSLGFVSLEEHILDYKCKFYTDILLSL